MKSIKQWGEDDKVHSISRESEEEEEEFDGFHEIATIEGSQLHQRFREGPSLSKRRLWKEETALSSYQLSNIFKRGRK